MKRDIDYIVKDGEVLIVDEHTGRIMEGRRYSEGLHQAIEAKEDVKIANENKTLATITFQNYFKLYNKLCGMTGTAMTEEEEFRQIYNLDVVEIPTNKPMLRDDKNDIVYTTRRGKLRQVVKDIKESYEKGQPMLVGTTNIERSEELSALLKKEGVKHEVLNAKFHEKEAEIVAQAGKFGAVTIATNMAGRGTDIMLGGNTEALAKHELKKKGYTEEQIMDAISLNETDDEEILAIRKEYKEYYDKIDKTVKEEREKVIAVGGLKIIGTERHDSRRIDNQLRGRSGRQGDVGESRFYISLEDDLMKIFGGDRLQNAMSFIKISEDMPIGEEGSIGRMLSGSIEGAQKRVESIHFQSRKNVLRYDNVMNDQRKIIYDQRRKVLDGENIRNNIMNMLNRTVEEVVDSYFNVYDTDDINIEAFENYLQTTLTVDYKVGEERDPDVIKEKVLELAKEQYAKKEEELGERVRE